ncbi:hypothetical protein PAXINDRAFT_102546 [Paxillus involutus ATCC 200175]|uniref:Uncharacterized protein n=1 Tax=Paxillus involutus ATCC 200175 TaxID=664439 RepID=A0A0C9SNW0_PAXIN|nr:hypothetical protein PAXINDRAFT_102546 [Paxillus involutus ATCC 200175]
MGDNLITFERRLSAFQEYAFIVMDMAGKVASTCAGITSSLLKPRNAFGFTTPFESEGGVGKYQGEPIIIMAALPASRDQLSGGENCSNPTREAVWISADHSWIAQKLGELRPALLTDSRLLQLIVPLMGITGDFTLRASPNVLASKTSCPSRELSWYQFDAVPGDVGWLRGTGDGENEVGGHVYDIILVLLTCEPEVLLPLVMRAARYRDDDTRGSSLGTMTIHLFSRSPLLSSTLPTAEIQQRLTVDVKQHAGRLSKDMFRESGFKDGREGHTQEQPERKTKDIDCTSSSTPEPEPTDSAPHAERRRMRVHKRYIEANAPCHLDLSSSSSERVYRGTWESVSSEVRQLEVGSA